MFLKRRVARIISDFGNWTAYDARALPGSNSPIRRAASAISTMRPFRIVTSAGAYLDRARRLAEVRRLWRDIVWVTPVR